MKFRAKMNEALSMKNLALIASVINKQCKQCTLRLNSQNFTLMVTDENSSPKQVVIWCVLEATKFFSEYFVEGISESNEIYLLVPPEMLSMSLNTLKATNNNAKSVKLKLANKITPCLTVEIVLSTECGMNQNCVHDIPVKLISRQAWSDYGDPPPQDDCDVALEMKTFKKLKAVLEKFRKLSPWVALSVTSEGNLSSSVTSSTATVTTLFKNTVASYSSDDLRDKDHTVRTDVKKLCLLMSTESLTPKRAMLYFAENRRISFYLACDSFAFHFFIMGVEE
ncbi:Hypothetical protein NTJ_11491 [Nesidiocoris tenuis]|uniref:Checkpoint protein n=1 Tax=Nesidiocoris tenuis TaxID=355587 RepID=A0ABN7B2N4_9HEMI|nr:Hypothetical protein NTJ_11491 [Nesidiocoris tenuis]